MAKTMRALARAFQCTLSGPLLIRYGQILPLIIGRQILQHGLISGGKTEAKDWRRVGTSPTPTSSHPHPCLCPHPYPYPYRYPYTHTQRSSSAFRNFFWTGPSCPRGTPAPEVRSAVPRQRTQVAGASFEILRARYIALDVGNSPLANRLTDLVPASLYGHHSMRTVFFVIWTRPLVQQALQHPRSAALCLATTNLQHARPDAH